VTDLDVDYQLTPLVRLGVSVNNLFNVYPEAIDSKGDPLTDLGGRFRYPWEVNQFGFNGTTVTGNLNITF
jgi:iron complex outermembrane receptor protein